MARSLASDVTSSSHDRPAKTARPLQSGLRFEGAISLSTTRGPQSFPLRPAAVPASLKRAEAFTFRGKPNRRLIVRARARAGFHLFLHQVTESIGFENQ